MTQTKIHAERLRRIQSVLRSCVALAIAIAALATPLTGCTSVKPQLKAVKLSSEDKDAIARLMAYNCFIDYDSRKPETGIIHILFSDVSQVSFEPYKMNSDEIATCELLDGNIFKLIVYNDVSETYHSISIRAEDVAVEGE